jgi:hypothetical protein
MRRLAPLCFALAAGLFLPACVTSRRIADFAVHPSYNSYKVITVGVRYAFFSAWTTYEAWNCSKVSGRFVCSPISYDQSKRGIPGSGVVPPGATAAPTVAAAPAPSGTSPVRGAP